MMRVMRIRLVFPFNWYLFLFVLGYEDSDTISVLYLYIIEKNIISVYCRD